ncbi:ArsR/SmtB family transcription factor [Wenxinia saemankumensis]|uniref:Transcriptional regulator, ArsR family n=1 Tax=Wenxinia saemankumensis TaxID=1447782 RepID=A0A1M6CPK6_9RHOB|nr:metalloregulator ArsR/SmtB family transcription factor [Wenxinia saemankumensis]SHI62899.1 transcriptional regulator, ArsR family [Wenxinia saemankumensis]
MADLDMLFGALADPTRRAILRRLADGPAGVEELRAPFNMSQPAISKHLKVLEGAGLVEVEVDGPRRPRRLVPAPLVEATRWLERTRDRFEANFAALDTVLDEMTNETSTGKETP